jgi:hypothetical protein
MPAELHHSGNSENLSGSLSGFGYPSTPAPCVLNVISTIRAFIAALTLFLPQRPAPGQAPQSGRDERTHVASRPPVIPRQRSPRSRTIRS